MQMNGNKMYNVIGSLNIKYIKSTKCF